MLRSLSVAVFFGLVGLILSPSEASGQQTVTCESRDNRLQRCPVDTRGGVDLERQLSRTPCRYNGTWGYDRRGIWVADGCRATFRVEHPGWSDGSGGSWGGGGRGTVRCESRDNRRQNCPADTRRGVSLDHQLSKSPCRFGQTWGYDRRGIWVQDGCRADFRLSGGPHSGSGPGWGGGSVARGSVRCESRDNRRQYCRADTRGGVSVQQQLSRTACQFRRTWGWDSGGVWVQDGCRAVFDLGRRGAAAPYGSSLDGDNDDGAAVAGAVLVGALAAAIGSSVADGHDREAVEACQQATERRIRESERGADVEFSSGASRKLGDRQRAVHGEGEVWFGRNSRRFAYDCEIDMRDDSILSADWGFSN